MFGASQHISRGVQVDGIKSLKGTQELFGKSKASSFKSAKESRGPHPDTTLRLIQHFPECAVGVPASGNIDIPSQPMKQVPMASCYLLSAHRSAHVSYYLLNRPWHQTPLPYPIWTIRWHCRPTRERHPVQHSQLTDERDWASISLAFLLPVRSASAPASPVAAHT